MTNDELLAEWAHAEADGGRTWIYETGAKLAAALRAEQEKLSAAEDVICEAQSAISWTFIMAEHVADARRILSSYKPEEGKN